MLPTFYLSSCHREIFNKKSKKSDIWYISKICPNLKVVYSSSVIVASIERDTVYERPFIAFTVFTTS